MHILIVFTFNVPAFHFRLCPRGCLYGCGHGGGHGVDGVVKDVVGVVIQLDDVGVVLAALTNHSSGNGCFAVLSLGMVSLSSLGGFDFSPLQYISL